MTVALDNLRVKGAIAQFHQAMETAPTVWQNHAQIIQSTSDTENHNFPGFLPQPREFLDSRQFQGMRDFTYNVANKEYELSMLLARNWLEDDQNSLLMARISEMAEVWATYKDSLFADLLAAGNVSGSQGFDGATFHQDTRAIGDSGNFDNNLSFNAGSTSQVTAAEAQDIIQDTRGVMFGYQDDQGRSGFNSNALTNMRVIVPPGHERGFWQAINETLVSSGESNQWTSTVLAGVDTLPYLAATTEIFFSALGSVRKPFIMQERTPLEIVLLNGTDDIAENNGVLVLTRQRFILTYGDPRRNALVTIT